MDYNYFKSMTARCGIVERQCCRTLRQIRQTAAQSMSMRRYAAANSSHHAEYIGKRTLCLELSGKRRRGRQKTRFMDVVREDMRVVGVSDKDSVSREKVATPNGSSRKKKKKFKSYHYDSITLPRMLRVFNFSKTPHISRFTLKQSKERYQRKVFKVEINSPANFC